MSEVCIVCGEPKPKRNKMFCSKCCEATYRQKFAVCPICGNQFSKPPSSEKCCCSPVCSSAWRKKLYEAGKYDNALEVWINKKEQYLKEHTGKDHFNAKQWVIQSPTGKVYECTNLMYFIREHPELFDGTPKQAFDGFAKIKATMQGKQRKRPSRSWKGWTLINWSD